jgi:hypothetical protein|tara:strand:+ start:275 stop:925 length:651 start_codon:yes stop_codon:yes gene_type:complete
MKKQKNLDTAIIVLLVVLTLLVVNNQLKINNLLKTSPSGYATATETQTAEVSVVPTGVPGIYGKELGISYDDVSPYDAQLADATIRKLAYFDQNIELNDQELERYTTTLLQISCEYCCGAQSIIFSNGAAACGCAHSYAMRGLAKYLLTEHPDDFTNDEILEELGKWKTLFFPGQIQAKAAILSQKGVELNYINLASNKYRGIEQGSGSGQMVGGC